MRRKQNSRLLLALIGITLSVTASEAQGPTRPGRAAAVECVPFKSPPRLMNGQSLRVPIMRGLELRLSPNEAVKVAPVGAPNDVSYVWIVSPPLQYAPQLYLGPSYGIPPELVQGVEPLHFVLKQADFDRVFTAVYERGVSGSDYFDLLKQLTLGTVTIKITGRGVKGLQWDWVSFTGEACVP
jgi:hypothetical protein